jgi:lycopene cyclase domain-containing protein
MKEYTIASVIAVLLVVVLDRWLDTRLLGRRAFWITIAVMFWFKIIFNGYLTWRPIVMYGPGFFLGLRLGTIPLEDFLYGFSVIGATVVLWEKFRIFIRPKRTKHSIHKQGS